MDVNRAIDLLQQALSEIPYLTSLHHDNQEYLLWYDKVQAILEAKFGLDAKEYKKFSRSDLQDFIFSPLLSDRSFQENYLENLKNNEKTLKAVITTLKARRQRDEIFRVETKPAAMAEPPADTAELPSYLFDNMQFHPRIIRASKSLFNSGHYAEAIFAAFKAVNNFTKRKTGLSLDGKDLMAKAFNEDKPIIKLNKLLTRSEQDEQEGFRFLFMGAMVGIRNPKAHDDIRQIDPYRTLEYLAFASLLMRRVTEGKLESENK